jgi:uncharacterized membrane protein
MTPARLSDELRHGTSDDLRRRRGVIGLALGSAGVMGLISLYQTGILRHLPEPRWPGLDADRVNGSAQAYEILGTPDGLLGLASYATTAALAAAGGADRARDRPWVPLAMAGKVAFDAALAAKLTWDQKAKHHAFCLWCLLSAAMTFGMVPLVWPEARRAIRRLVGG